MSQSEFSLPLRVYIEDTDAGGIVFYVNYLKYMERARTELLRQLGYDKPAVSNDGLLMVVTTVNVDYKRSARLDDQLLVGAEITHLGRSYMIFRQRVCKVGSDDILCEGHVKVACIKRDTMRPCPLPASIHASVQQYLGKNEA